MSEEGGYRYDLYAIVVEGVTLVALMRRLHLLIKMSSSGCILDLILGGI